MKIIAQSVGRAQEPKAKKEPIYLAWEDYLAKWKATAPKGMKNCFQNADYFWAFI
jgi:hypothetical protein